MRRILFTAPGGRQGPNARQISLPLLWLQDLPHACR